MSLHSYTDALILNVDDNDGARYAKSRILTHAGFKIIEARTGGDALLKAHRENPNLILLDVQLPDINGMEVCRQLKADPTTQTILILQTSASFIGSADKIRGLDGGADNYLVEPIEPDELIANVKALLRLGKVERELREVDRRKDEFLATLGHELRNPLAPLLNSVDLWYAVDPKVTEIHEKIRGTIKRQTKHLVRLVDDLLDVSRIAQGKISLQWEQVELKTFINNAIESSTHSIQSRHHELSVNLPAQDIWVRGDQVRLAQIMTNLLLNAAKFTHPGGKINLDIQQHEQQLIIRLTDNGIGIAEPSIAAIFELFAQDGHIANQMRDGLGIGLSLVRKLVELHDGTVKAYSAGTGKGSTFEICLPVSDINKAQTAMPVASHTHKPKRVLIVDDNEAAADTLGELLSLGGHCVRMVYTGEEAIEAMSEFNPDVVLLDIGLPNSNGFDVARKLRSLPNAQHFLLVAVTGYGQSALQQSASKDFDEYFVKPMSFDKLESIGLHV